MKIIYYNCKRDDRYVQKLCSADKTNLTTQYVEMLTPSNLTNPKIKVSTEILDHETNYCYIDDLKRYYYIRNWNMDNGYVVLDLEVDVLMTFQKPLLDSEVIIRRVDNYVVGGTYEDGDIEWRYPKGAMPNYYLKDDRLRLNAYNNVRTIEFEKGFDEDVQEFFLTIAGDVSSADDPDDPPSGGDYSFYVIAAICGNFWHESSLNPAIWESLSAGDWTSTMKGYGLGQWTNVGSTHGRLYNLHQWTHSKGFADDDGDGQLSYLVYEDYWTPHTDYPQFQTLTDFLTSNSTDIATLTHAFNRCWEGIHDSSWDVRVTYAQNVYNYLQSHYTDSVNWIKGNRYLSDSERYNNSVKVYQYFN